MLHSVLYTTVILVALDGLYSYSKMETCPILACSHTSILQHAILSFVESTYMFL